MKTLTCERCGRKEAYGLLSSMAWSGESGKSVCPECSAGDREPDAAEAAAG